MATRRPEGTALLVAGHGALGALDASALHTLGQIGEALLATGAAWQIRRLAATAGADYAPDRGALKQHLDELAAEPARAAVVVLIGQIIAVDGEPALVTGSRAREYPEDASLSLAWIRDRLHGARAERLVCVLSARPEPGAHDDDQAGSRPAAWLAALATEQPAQLVAIATSDGDRHPIVEALLTALCGDALDARTGTVTMASLSDYLAAQPGAYVQTSDASDTLAQPPPLAGLWDVRRSQLSIRTRPNNRPRTADDSEDLTGSVLPGRFRIDQIIARGTFGTVYRARQLAVERDVAIKVLHAEIDPASDDGRLFVHEIRSAGRLDHANVVRILQADITHDGRLFFAMELLDGQDLQQLATDQPLPQHRAIELTRQLLAGLGAAHDAGLVHADVKPANAIVVTRDGVERVVLVDFGLARLRTPDHPTESAGGTPAYMAPEQMHLGRIDARSDLFSAALVLVYLLTGWRRPNAYTPAPQLDIIVDPVLRSVLARALDMEPSRRYASARELISALTGAAPPSSDALPAQLTPFRPFRQLAAFTEADRGRLYGREYDLAALTQHALYRRAVIYTAPSGTGKTSLLRAGLMPRLEALGVHPVYLRCRADSSAQLAAAIWPDGPSFADANTVRTDQIGSPRPPEPPPSIADAIASWHRQRGGKLVLVLDQVEAALADDNFVRDALGFASWPADAEVAVVLSIREDHLARLYDRAQRLEPGIPLVRLPPLSPDGARAAITGPLTEARLSIEPDLLDALLADLQRAARAIGPEMGWGTEPAVFPPHLQLACSALYQALDSGEAMLTLAHYKRLGGFDAIVGEHLERVLDSELTEGAGQIARALFVALVTASHERAMRAESELIAIVGDVESGVTAVLELLRVHGLVVRVRGNDGEPSWELAHDSLVPRVLAWIDARDLDRRRAVELVRYHLRRSRPETPSLLGRAELRELLPHPAAIAALDDEWRRRGTDEPWTPSRLIHRSRQVLRRQTASFAALAAIACAIAGASMVSHHVDAMRRDAEAELKARNLGRFTLELQPFDWDPVKQEATAVDAAKLGFDFELRVWTDDQPGEPFDRDDVRRGPVHFASGARIQDVEARGGRAFLIVQRSGCAPSLLPLKELPGYAERERAQPTFSIRIPTCAASLAGTAEIPAGPFYYGGLGTPPALDLADEPEAAERHQLDLPAFRLERTEVTNAAFNVFADLASRTGIDGPIYPNSEMLIAAGGPRKPVTGINWHTARAYCRYMGRDLPTSEQWVKAMRGGLTLPDGTANPIPDRNFPFGEGDPTIIAALTAPISEVATHPRDISPYGIYDMTGNAEEWTLTAGKKPGIRVIRGGGLDDGMRDAILYVMAIANTRVASQPLFEIGVRCAINP